MVSLEVKLEEWDLICRVEDSGRKPLYNSQRRVKIHSSSSELNYILNDVKEWS